MSLQPGWSPGDIPPLCPRCLCFVEKDAEELNGAIFHAGCLADLFRSEAESRPA